MTDAEGMPRALGEFLDLPETGSAGLSVDVCPGSASPAGPADPADQVLFRLPSAACDHRRVSRFAVCFRCTVSPDSARRRHRESCNTQLGGDHPRSNSVPHTMCGSERGKHELISGIALTRRPHTTIHQGKGSVMNGGRRQRGEFPGHSALTRRGEPGRAFLSERRRAFEDVRAHEAEHLVGGGLVEDRAGHLEPVVQ